MNKYVLLCDDEAHIRRAAEFKFKRARGRSNTPAANGLTAGTVSLRCDAVLGGPLGGVTWRDPATGAPLGGPTPGHSINGRIPATQAAPIGGRFIRVIGGQPVRPTAVYQ